MRLTALCSERAGAKLRIERRDWAGSMLNAVAQETLSEIAGLRVESAQDAVSYTHLDVYKRQPYALSCAEVTLLETPLTRPFRLDLAS